MRVPNFSLLLALAALLFAPTAALGQDNDGDSFSPAQGDCDDNNPANAPNATEVCDGSDNDCDGLSDEVGASPALCGTQAATEQPFENTIDGNLILHTERFVESVDLTGIDIYQSVQANLTTPGGPMTNVQSLFVRNWMGTSSYQVIADALFTFPAGVTPVGWIIDRSGGGPVNRSLDAIFSTVPGGLGISATNNTQFESSAQDYAWVNGQQALIHTYIASAADEARLLITYDPATVGALEFTVEMGTGAIQDLTLCSQDLPGLTTFTVPLTTADGQLVDDDGDGLTECYGDCDDTSALTYQGAPELCDQMDNDCDGALPAAEVDGDGDGLTDCEGDCDDSQSSVNPAAPELCDAQDNDCDGSLGSDELDDDGDGFSECDGDCNDLLTAVAPGAAELCNGIDDDCDLLTDAADPDSDADGDGHSACATDCDDSSAAVLPGGIEVCNGVDDDCDGLLDGVDPDTDGDGDGISSCSGDCNDANNTVGPGLPELCDALDNNCDGSVDEGFDGDGDLISTCNGDCNDANAAVYPGATEVCDGFDNNCDSTIDEGFDSDSDGLPDCFDLEVCDGLDNDGDGAVDEGFDNDGLGGADCLDDDGDGYSELQGDCNDADSSVLPGATELCDGIDNDCNVLTGSEPDYDNDGISGCDGDCAEFDASIYPGAAELCDNIDNDCSGLIDDDPACFFGDDDDSAGDDDDSAGDDDDSAGDDDDGDDDDSAADDDDGDDDDSAADDDDGDDDDSAADDDDGDDDDSAADDDDGDDDDSAADDDDGDDDDSAADDDDGDDSADPGQIGAGGVDNPQCGCETGASGSQFSLISLLFLLLLVRRRPLSGAGSDYREHR